MSSLRFGFVVCLFDDVDGVGVVVVVVVVSAHEQSRFDEYSSGKSEDLM